MKPHIIEKGSDVKPHIPLPPPLPSLIPPASGLPPPPPPPALGGNGPSLVKQPAKMNMPMGMKPKKEFNLKQNLRRANWTKVMDTYGIIDKE